MNRMNRAMDSVLSQMSLVELETVFKDEVCSNEQCDTNAHRVVRELIRRLRLRRQRRNTITVTQTNQPSIREILDSLAKRVSALEGIKEANAKNLVAREYPRKLTQRTADAIELVMSDATIRKPISMDDLIRYCEHLDPGSIPADRSGRFTISVLTLLDERAGLECRWASGPAWGEVSHEENNE